MNYATLLAEMFVGGWGYCWFLTYIYMCQNLSHTSIIGIKLTSIILSIPQNRLIGYIVTLSHSDKLLWENVMNYATLAEMFV